MSDKAKKECVITKEKQRKQIYYYLPSSQVKQADILSTIFFLLEVLMFLLSRAAEIGNLPIWRTFPESCLLVRQI